MSQSKLFLPWCTCRGWVKLQHKGSIMASWCWRIYWRPRCRGWPCWRRMGFAAEPPPAARSHQSSARATEKPLCSRPSLLNLGHYLPWCIHSWAECFWQPPIWCTHRGLNPGAGGCCSPSWGTSSPLGMGHGEEPKVFPTWPEQGHHKLLRPTLVFILDKPLLTNLRTGPKLNSSSVSASGY